MCNPYVLIFWGFPVGFSFQNVRCFIRQTIILELFIVPYCAIKTDKGSDWLQCRNNVTVYFHLYSKHRFICLSQAIFVERTKLKLKLLTPLPNINQEPWRRQVLATSTQRSTHFFETVSILM